MIFTNSSGNMQPYVSWKGPSTNSVAPTWSRPLYNGPPSNNNPTNENRITGAAFKARPIKAWRKQLQPRNTSGQGSSSGIGINKDFIYCPYIPCSFFPYFL